MSNQPVPRLCLRYKFDPSYSDKTLPSDDFGWLTVEVASEKFAGEGGFWVQWQDIVELGQKLAEYPISPNSPVTEQWGYDMQTGEDLILFLSIGASPDQRRLTVTVEVADLNYPKNRVRIDFETHYGAVARFSQEIGALMTQQSEKAVLLSE